MHPTLRAFRSRSFRIFYTGQFISVLGSWMQTVATSWLVYRLTGSAFLLGLTAFSQQIAVLFLAPIAGVIADRISRRRALIVVQTLALCQAVVLAVLMFSGAIQVWHIIAVSLLLGVINSFETPMRQSFLLELIEDRSDLPNAIALQSMLMNTTRLIGPSLAGIILALFGEAWCFALNALSYTAIVLAYGAIDTRAQPASTRATRWWQELIEGIRYAFGSRVSRRLLILLGAAGFLTAPWQTLLPILSKESFGGDSRTFGFLIGAVGIGAVAGTLYLAGRASVRGLGNIIAMCSLLSGVALVGFSFATSFWQSLVILPVFGFGLVVTGASINQILQSISDDDKRGRMVSLYVTVFMGMTPLGNLAGGTVADSIGAHWTLCAFGAAYTLVALWFMVGLGRWRESARNLYLKKGIL